jgi:hypothetical protein
MKTKSVEILGQKKRVGDWLVVDAAMTKILASDSTPEKALRKAGIDPHGGRRGRGPRPIVMQVMDPAMTCLY